jgi:hypothetical protein
MMLEPRVALREIQRGNTVHVLRQVRIEVGFLRDPEDWQPTWSALLYWRKRLIVPFLRFGVPPTAIGTLPIHAPGLLTRTAAAL